MVRMMSHIEDHGASWSSVPLAVGLFVSISALVALCAKSARRKLATKAREQPQMDVRKSPLGSPRRIISTISNKASSMSFLKKKKGERNEGDKGEGFGEAGLWQNNILMGEKCQPLEFSGAIFYDNYGNRLSELPKSPRANPLSTFSFPVVRE